MQALHNTRLETQYVSNTGAAIAGNEVFGPFGALVGGMPEEITTTYESDCLFIVYDEGTEGIVLAARKGGANGPGTQSFKKIVEDFNNNDASPTVIEL